MLINFFWGNLDFSKIKKLKKIVIVRDLKDQHIGQIVLRSILR